MTVELDPGTYLLVDRASKALGLVGVAGALAGVAGPLSPLLGIAGLLVGTATVVVEADG